VGLRSILVIGGARSGKSRFAQELALAAGEAVLFVATAAPLDEEMRQRIEAHRKSRPASWRTLEVNTRIGGRIAAEIADARVVIVDCITLLVSNVCAEYNEPVVFAVVEERVVEEITGLVECFGRTDAGFILVTNEVGSGLVPTNELGRLYRDCLGKANQLLAERVDEVYLMVAGLPVKIKPS